MLNYNLNIIEPLQQAKKGKISDPVIVWTFEEKTITPLEDLNVVLSNATMNVYATHSNCIGITTSSNDFFYTDPVLNVTASLTGSGVWPTTGSVTMSILSYGLNSTNGNTLTYYTSYVATEVSGNLNQSGSVISSSFVLPLDYNWNISGSIITHKGNESNSKINWRESGSTNSDDNCIFKIVKNANEVLVPNTYMTASQSGSFFNDYAFNITSSISGTANWEHSSSFQALTMSISIPELGYYVTSSHTASIITGSFAAAVNINPYNITASLILEPFPSYSLDEFVFVGGGGDGGGVAQNSPNSGGGGGAGSVVSGSGMWVYPNSIYWVNIGKGSGSIDNGTTFTSQSNYYIYAPNGGNGAGSNEYSGSNGGSGGGSTGGDPNNYHIAWPGGKSIAAIYTGSINVFITGSTGGAGRNYSPEAPIPTYFGLAGGGGGASGSGQDAREVGFRAVGGLGVSSSLITTITGQTGSFANGGEAGWAPSFTNPGPNPNVTPNGKNALTYGSGGGGAQGSEVSASAGLGYQGIAIIKYAGPQRGRGGVYSFDGTYSYHTFTSSSNYWSTANMQPIMH